MRRIGTLTLDNFTVFKKLLIDFSQGINVLIGPNATGKTHILKLLYAACDITVTQKPFIEKVEAVFRPWQGDVNRLLRRAPGNITGSAAIFEPPLEGKSIEVALQLGRKGQKRKLYGEKSWRAAGKMEAAYIPVKEMLAHAEGFLALSERREIAFEEVYADIIRRATLPALKGPTGSSRTKLRALIEKAISGRVKLKGEAFFLTNKSGDLEFPLLAEGLRKLALLLVLINNGTLEKGSFLFWDEPEANINPSLLGVVADILLALEEMGTQIFIATHNYVLLKELELRRKKKHSIRFHSLWRNAEDTVQVQSAEELASLQHDPILDAYLSIYDREVAGMAQRLGAK